MLQRSQQERCLPLIILTVSGPAHWLQ